MTPFADDEASVSIGDLTAENGRDMVALSGSVEITRDEIGLKRARALKALAGAMVAELEKADLPDRLERKPKPVDKVTNPFA